MDLSNNEIKHIVCSGGGVYGFTFYGILKEANKKGLWQREKIKSLYGTSVGTILLLLIVLDYTWEELDNYLLSIDEKEYNKRILSIREYLKSDSFQLFLKLQVLCQNIFTIHCTPKMRFHSIHGRLWTKSWIGRRSTMYQ